MFFAVFCGVMCKEIDGSAMEDESEPRNETKGNPEVVFSVFSIQLPDRSVMDSIEQQQPLKDSSSESLIATDPKTGKSDDLEPLQEDSAPINGVDPPSAR